tara:strand:+ start:2582 stop:4045 length:1464 start_codon:yes stop_codon:yes gene_type:complete
MRKQTLCFQALFRWPYLLHLTQQEKSNPVDNPSRSGVFDAAADNRVASFTESISFDARLYSYDILGSIAHAKMLQEIGILTADEAVAIETTLLEIKTKIEVGDFQTNIALEDIHMHIEALLIDELGDVGRKLHTGRSRNDQVSTDFRLWVRAALDNVDQLLLNLQQAFLNRCGDDHDVILPGYTHLQRAQPILASHYWLAYCEKLQRDRQRIADCRKRVNVSSLGVAAVAGTSIPINRDTTAELLGFEGVAANSLDVSSDRDFVLESAFVLSTIAIHLSGWAEEWILWKTAEFDFIDLPHEFCTGSSIMPQKINPDILELIRGKTGRVVGSLQTLLIILKGLPLAYNRDLQEDKPALFDAFDTITACLDIAAPLVAGASLNREKIAASLDKGFLDATTLMEYLILRGTPQRTAHHLIGSLVAVATKQNVALKDLPLEEFQKLDADLDEDIYGVLGVQNAVAAFTSFGSTAPDQVAAQITAWKERLGL